MVITSQRLLIVLGAVTAAIFVCWSWASFGPRPYFFKEIPLRSNRGEANTLQDAAVRYFLGSFNALDAPKPERLRVSTVSASSDHAVVDLFVANGEGGGDSTSVSYQRFTLQRTPTGWNVVRHQAAWQGRGRIGWTTKPTL